MHQHILFFTLGGGGVGWIGGVSSGAPAMAGAAEARGGHAIRSLTQTLHGQGERVVRREERVRIRPRRRAGGICK